MLGKYFRRIYVVRLVGDSSAYIAPDAWKLVKDVQSPLSRRRKAVRQREVRLSRSQRCKAMGGVWGRCSKAMGGTVFTVQAPQRLCAISNDDDWAKNLSALES